MRYHEYDVVKLHQGTGHESTYAVRRLPLYTTDFRDRQIFPAFDFGNNTKEYAIKIAQAAPDLDKTFRDLQVVNTDPKVGLDIVSEALITNYAHAVVPWLIPPVMDYQFFRHQSRQPQIENQLPFAPIMPEVDQVFGLLVMELLKPTEYLPLELLITSDSPQLPLDFIFRVTEKIGRGVDCLSRKGIYHRDIHTKNVMVGLRDQVKLLDLGIAFKRDLSLPESTPVPCNNQGSGDTASLNRYRNLVSLPDEVYSLAAMVYAMLAHKQLGLPGWIDEHETAVKAYPFRNNQQRKKTLELLRTTIDNGVNSVFASASSFVSVLKNAWI